MVVVAFLLLLVLLIPKSEPFASGADAIVVADSEIRTFDLPSQIARKLRGANIHSAEEPNPCTACCCHFWCSPCALSQENRAISNWRNAGGDPKKY
jgi:hypothetical protein